MVYPSDVPISEVREKHPYFTFAFIRNPFDRIVSNYNFNKGRWLDRALKEGTNIDHVPTFKEYCFDMENWNIVPPLVSYLDVDIDFIGRFENFRQSFDDLHKILGINVVRDQEGNHPLKRKVNASNRNPLICPHCAGYIRERGYKEYYDSESRKEIARRYKEDFRRFGYAF